MIGPDTDIPTIVDGCIRQHPAAQKELVRRYAAILLSVAHRYARTPDAAEDILQEAYILIFKKIHQFRSDKGALVGWMGKIVIHTALAHYRNFRFQYEQATEALPDCLETAPDALSQLNFEELVDLIATLPEASRMVFQLSVFDDYSHDEIAALLHIPAGTSRSLLSRARKLLQEKIINRQSNELARI